MTRAENGPVIVLDPARSQWKRAVISSLCEVITTMHAALYAKIQRHVAGTILEARILGGGQ